MLKKYSILVTLILAPFFISGCITGIYQDESDGRPQDEQTCEEQGGQWEDLGVLEGHACNLPTKDAGHECSDSTQCDGSCILKDGDVSLTNVNGEMKVVGQCSAWDLNEGCRSFIEDGKVIENICEE